MTAPCAGFCARWRSLETSERTAYQLPVSQLARDLGDEKRDSGPP